MSMPMDWLLALPPLPGPGEELTAAQTLPGAAVTGMAPGPDVPLAGELGAGASPYDATQQLTTQNLDHLVAAISSSFDTGLDPNISLGSMGGLGGTGSGTAGFTPVGNPGSAQDYGGEPGNLLTRHGVTGVPAGVRELFMGARATGIAPEALSNAVFGSGFRTHAEQAALYQSYLNGTHPALVAPPGHSMHEVGRAWDINQNFLADHPTFRSWLVSHGFSFPVSGEPWHAEWHGSVGFSPTRRRPSTGASGYTIIDRTTPRHTTHTSPKRNTSLQGRGHRS